MEAVNIYTYMGHCRHQKRFMSVQSLQEHYEGSLLPVEKKNRQLTFFFASAKLDILIINEFQEVTSHLF